MSAQSINKSRLGADFTSGPIFPLLFRFFLPFLFANLLNSLYNTIDTIIIGQIVGSTGIVAVSLGGKMLDLFTKIGVALAGGGQVLIAQEVGAKRYKELNSSIGTMFSEMLLLSIVFSVVTLVFSRNIIIWLNTPEEAFDAALSYLRITCIGLPLIFGYNAVSSVLRGMGDSRHPLIFIAIAAAFNLVGDIIFIVGFHLGAVGTAIATVLGQGLSLVCSLTFLYRRRDQFNFDFRLKSFAIHREKLNIMLRLGLPNVMRSVCVTSTQLLLMSRINLFGLIESAAYSVGDKVYHLINIIGFSVSNAGGSMVGQNFGAGKHDRIRSVVGRQAVLIFSAASLLSLFSVLFPTQLFGLFTDEPGVLAYAPTFMGISCIIYFLSGFEALYQSVLIGTGNSLLNMIAGVLDGTVLRVGFSFLFAYGLNLGVVGFFLADALARLAGAVVGGVYYHSGLWEKREILVKK